MKTKTLLALASVATISVAAVGSYAAWDNLSATASATSSAVIEKIDVSAKAMLAPTITRELNKEPVISADAKFDLSSVTTQEIKDKVNFNLVVAVKAGVDGTTALTEGTDYTLAVTNDAGEMVGLVDNRPAFSDEETYNVVVTVKEGTTKVAAGDKIAIEVTGTLVEAEDKVA